MIYDDKTIAAKYLIKTAYIVRVTDVDPVNQTVDVMQDFFEFAASSDGSFSIINEYGNPIAADPLVPFFVCGIPFQQLRWGKFSIQCTPQVGDTGLLVVFTDDMRKWLEDGGASVAGSGSKFSIDSSMFIPFVANQKNKAVTYPEPDTELTIKGENISIKLTDNGTDANISIIGDVSIQGNLTTSGDISSDGDVKAGNVSLKNHTHTIPAQTPLVNPETGQTTADVVIPSPDTEGA